MTSWRQQTRLLLWKDYLIRKRKLVSLTGAVWATLVVLSLVLVRKNIDTQDVPTCQYAARALPSAGMLAFLQSFICTVNNECLPLDQYREIPLYEHSRIRQLERQFSPLLYNETILEAAEVMPDALKLVASLAKAIDDPDIHQIGRNGLHLRDFFIDPDRVTRYLAHQLDLGETVIDVIMAAEINFQDLFNASMEKCDVGTLSALLEASPESLQQLSAKLCSLPQQALERLAMPLLAEINYRKFFNMVGAVVSEARWMGGAAAAALRLFRLENYVPAELTDLLLAPDQLPRAYFNLTVIKSFMDLFEPTYGETSTYKTMRGVSDVLVDGVQWMYSLLQRPIKSTKSGSFSTLSDAVAVVVKGLKSANGPLSMRDVAIKLESLRAGIRDGFEILSDAADSAPMSTASVFPVLSKMGSALVNLLPKKSRHEVLYYLTLLTKLLEGAHATVDTNLRMEEIMYNVSRRHPDAVELLTALQPSVIAKTFDALADAERTQMFTSRLASPEQMFCDARRLQSFLRVARAEADALRAQLCGGAWRAYVTDVVTAFGIYDVKKNINKMASLVIAETIGKDNSADLYTIGHDFSALQSLVDDLSREREKKHLDWPRLFNVSDDAELFTVVRGKLPLVKNVLITVHGALAHEVVRQNPILEAKISPLLIRSSELVAALSAQLAAYPRQLVDGFRELYADIARTLLATLLDREKTYKALSTVPADMFCLGGTDVTRYLVFPDAVDSERVTEVLCLLTTQLDNTLDGNSTLAKAIGATLHEHVNPMKDVNWLELISQLRNLYSLLEKDFGYVLAPATYRMDNVTAAGVAEMCQKVKHFWFGNDHLDSALHLSLKLGLTTLDLLDRRLFDLPAHAPSWREYRSGATAANSFLVLAGQMVQLVTAFSSKNESFEIPELPITVNATRLILPNLPQLIKETADIVIADNTNISDVLAIVNGRPAWPCSERSLAGAVGLRESAADAARGLELLACAGRALRREWADSTYARTLHAAFSGKPDNSTPSEPRIFLKLSGNFDVFISELNEMDRTLKAEVWDSSWNQTRLSFAGAVKYAVDAFRVNDQNSTLFRRVFTKVDAVLDQIDSTPVDDSVPVAVMWEQYLKCSNGSYVDDECSAIGRAAWKYTLKYLSTAGNGMVDDLRKYFTEVNERNATLLQMLGFTRGTGLYTIYEKLPDFVGVLLNSYWDHGFMNQVRRASGSQFWDCAALVAALAAPGGGRVTRADLTRAQPYACPSVLHWISLPRGENALLDLVAKNQYYLYNLQANKLNSSFTSAYEQSIEFSKLIDDISKINRSEMTFNESVQTKFDKMVDGLLLLNISKDDSSYRLFNDVNRKQFLSTVYLTKVAMILNNISEKIFNTNVSLLKPEDAIEFSTVIKLLKQRPAAMMEIYFDAITEVLWRNESNYNIVNALNTLCQHQDDNVTDVFIPTDKKVFNRFCNRKYAIIHEVIGDVLDLGRSRDILKNFVEGLQNDGVLDDINPIEFFNNRKELVESLRRSMSYADELSVPLYVKYLRWSLQQQGVVLSFLAGGDWWPELRALYAGPYARHFFNTLEMSFQIGEDILTHLDKIKIVRLLKDANLNDTDMFCLDNVTLSDYIPDVTGALSRLKRNLCQPDRMGLFSELPPLVFASQGYEKTLKMSKDVNYTAIDVDIDEVRRKLRLIQNGPNDPRRPSWITEEKLQHLRGVTRNLFSKQSLTKIVFGTLSNVIDGVTLFMNSSDCGLCSPLTTWLRQINLQLIKKDEYDALLCHLPEMSLSDTYSALKNNFHWDMAIHELVSQRNYTTYELNKALNQFLDQVSSHVLQALTANTSRLRQCWSEDIGDNILGDVTFHLSIASRTLRMIRSAVTHLEEIEGIRRNDFLVQLFKDVAHRLPVAEPLATLLVNTTEFGRILETTVRNGSDLLRLIETAMVDISKVHNHTTITIFDWLTLNGGELRNVCSKVDCFSLSSLIVRHLNITDISRRLPALQASEFWRFRWVASALWRAERLLGHAGGVLAVGSRLHLGGGRITGLIDALLTVLQEDNARDILYGLDGIIEDLHPLLKDTELDFDLQSLSEGLRGLTKLRDSIVERSNLSVEVRRLVVEPARLEREMRQLGINDTGFWSVAAPALLAGTIQFKPLLTSRERSPSVSAYVCSPETAARVLRPAALGASERDVLGALAGQLCGMDEASTERLLPVLMKSLNTTFIFNQILDAVLLEVYRSSGLSAAAGERVLSRYEELMALAPAVRGSLANVSQLLAGEPLLAAFKEAPSVKDLLSSSEFLAHAGNMLCGKPLVTDSNRFYKAIAETKDFSTEPDPRQLETLPSDFCRSLYTDILSMAGGKILWSFVKPLIMGKILFTPDTTPVRQIISKANSSFAGVSRMRDLVGGLSGAFASLGSLARHRGSLATMRGLMASRQFRALAGPLAGRGAAGDAGGLDFEGMLEQLGDVGAMGAMVKKLSELLGCINLNRFIPAVDEPQLAHTAVELTALNEFSAGIVFVGDMQNPNDVEYKIRMDIESVPTTTRKRNQFWTPGPEASFIENMRYFRGFVQIQDLLDKAIVQRAHAHAHARSTRDVTGRDAPDWAVYTQQMPYPCYKRDVFQSSLYESQALIVAFFFSLILTVSSAVRFAVHERETGNTMLMSVMGMRMSSHTASWLVASLLEMLATSTAMFLVLKLGGVLPHSDPFLLWLIIFNFGFSVVMFCYMVSKLFSSASLGSVCTAILYLMMFLPFVIVLAMEAVLSTAGKLLTCISACTAFSYSVLHVARYEATGTGAQWSNVWRSPDTADTMSIASTTLIVLFDALLYAFVGWLVERLTEYKTHTDNLVNSKTSSEKAGVSIVNVSKVYTRGHKALLDNVSVELHRGQVTTLLGHNGAGKTTLIKIIMGVLKPTSGNIVIRSERVGGVKLGVCPQQDVLIENMTTAEHLRFYAMLKSGGTSDDVEHEVQSMLQVLCMGGLAFEQVRRLSGGMRRRLCVALAFVSSPQLVLLDEPSSGVDPVARRDIWSLIMKLKESRTVLLTTHHLDEAELLSDQIVIMHKGQVHTTGSPIEIKRSLGSGYKLTASYVECSPVLPDATNADVLSTLEEDPEQRTASIEEHSKDLLTVVRTVVKNAQLLDVKGRDVEITLPFFDANGLNTDFLRACELMESKQPELGFSSYSMDCSSLEQVFLGICQQADSLQLPSADRVVDFSAASSTSSNESQAKSASSASDLSALVGSAALAGTQWQQYRALLRKRALHYRRSARLLALLLALPTTFVLVAMGFSLIRPPADNEVALRLDPSLYGDATQFLVPHPSYINGAVNTTGFADDVMAALARSNLLTSEWNAKDNPHCECTSVRQECDYGGYNRTLPQLLTLPNTSALLYWATSTEEIYTEKRYGGWSAARAPAAPQLLAWYNNKGHHALPSYVNALSAAALRAASGDAAARLAAYTHPLKISHEQLSKSTLLQHVADVGIAGVILIGFSLIPAGAAVYLVTERITQQKRLQLLCGVTPTTYWLAATTWDMLIIVINIGLTVCVLDIFQLPVFVEKDNLPAICLLLLLFGWSCGSLVHVCEKLFSEASLANMLLFCGNVFLGVSGLAVLLILDIISDSDFTDNVRWTLHKVFLLSPQFALGDGLIEVAKNSIQAQVLRRFGMDTYRSPLAGGLLTHHYLALALLGALLFLLNLSIENDWHEEWLARWRASSSDVKNESEMEDLEVATERYRVELAAMRGRSVARPTHLHTIGNINAGFMNTEGKSVKLVKTASLPRTPTAAAGDVLQCLSLRKEFAAVGGRRVAVHSLTLGVPPGQCLALLGENGAGKSSTFGMLTGELRPTAGQVLLQEEPASRRQLCQGHISYCPQSDAVDALLSVREQLQFYCRLRGITAEQEVIRATLQLFELARYAEQRTGTLSGGNRRKLCTAAALMGRSPLVLLDEPTSGMDPGARDVVRRAVAAACGAGRAVLLSTHALDDVRALAQRLALLQRGRLRTVAHVQHSLTRWGGGWVVAVRTARGADAGRVRDAVRARLPHATLHAQHCATLQFLLPASQTGEEWRLSRVFRELAALQGEYEIEDFTVNRSSLYQMFANFSDKERAPAASAPSCAEVAESHSNEEPHSVTSL